MGTGCSRNSPRCSEESGAKHDVGRKEIRTLGKQASPEHLASAQEKQSP